MRRRLIALASVLFMTAASAQEAVGPSPAQEKDQFVGTWRANRDKSRPKLGKRDASYVRTISRDGEDVVFSSPIGTSERTENNYRIRCDGLFHPVPFGSLSCKYKAPNLIEGETIPLDTNKTEYWTRQVSADGQEMRISAYKNSARMKVKSIWILDRVK